MSKPKKNGARSYFGTDGIRGKVGDGAITAEFFLKLGWAVGRVLTDGKPGKILVGKDTRISGYMFESALEAGLSAAGVDIRLLGPMPTPAIAYLTRTLHAQAGIVISASHNSYTDNGLKFFSAQGTKLSDEVESRIEAELEKDIQIVAPELLGKAERVVDAPGRYIEFCKSTISSGTRIGTLKIVVDCAHGATYHIAPNVFEELGAEVITIGVQPDGLNINDQCGATAPQALRETVLAHQADVGIALDGDGDRLIMVDDQGDIVDGDEILYMIAMLHQQKGCLRGSVVGTVMSNLGMEDALLNNGIGFVRVAVGDRYIIDRLRTKDWSLGGESSGHIICLDKNTTGDGIVAALQVLEAMSLSGKTLNELKSTMTKFPQTLIGVPIRKGFDLDAAPDLAAIISAAESELGNNGRILIRPSGTEPLIRVMVEGRDEGQVEAMAQKLAQAVEQAQADMAEMETT